MTRKFKYKNWVVTLKRKRTGSFWRDRELSEYIRINAIGKSKETQGILYKKQDTCCVFDFPEILSNELKDLIYEKASLMLSSNVA